MIIVGAALYPKRASRGPEHQLRRKSHARYCKVSTYIPGPPVCLARTLHYCSTGTDSVPHGQTAPDPSVATTSILFVKPKSASDLYLGGALGGAVALSA